MNILKLAIAQLKSKPFNSTVSICMFALGMGIISLLLHFEKYTENQITGNLAGIDLVAGAKGSPLQLIMSSVLHIDNPTGNISLDEADKLSKNPLVKKSIPIALGDNYKGFRIVGTSKEYATIYQGELKTGDWNKQLMEVVIGNSVAENTKLKVGDNFTGVHGLVHNGHSHDNHTYLVTGILKPTGKIIDRVIITDVESVWKVHADNDDEHTCNNEHHEGEHHHCDHHQTTNKIDLVLAKIENHEELSEHEMELFQEYQKNKGVAKSKAGKEITALLVFYRSPMSAVTLPRFINQNTSMQSAVPLLQLNRLMSLLGYGFSVLNILAWVIIVFSGINIMVHLLNKLNQEIYDIALLRSLGVGRFKIMLLLLLQSIVLAVLGWIAGMVIVRITIFSIGSISDYISMPMKYGIISGEFIILIYALAVGIASAIIPAIKAYRTDIHFLLSQHE